MSWDTDERWRGPPMRVLCVEAMEEEEDDDDDDDDEKEEEEEEEEGSVDDAHFTTSVHRRAASYVKATC